MWWLANLTVCCQILFHQHLANAYIKDSEHLHFNIKGHFQNSTNTIACPSPSFKD